MDALKQISERPLLQLGRKFCNDFSVVNRGNIKLTPQQRIYIVNFGKEHGVKRFEGDPRERCQYEKCHTPLSVSDRYVYCRRHLKGVQDDFVKQSPEESPTKFLETLRRDQKPKKQIRRKRA